MNSSTHAGRNNEANKIASIVTKGIGENSKIITIRVEYMVRASASPAGKIVDTVEFRKGPDGVFDFHQS